MRAITSLTFVYEPREDRIAAAVNPGRPDAWSCWLTRRIALALLDRMPDFLEGTSALAKQAPAEMRGEFSAFEREAAIANTQGAMSVTPPDILKSSANAAELVDRVSITPQGDNFRVELYGMSGDGAAAGLARAELQRILQMLQGVVAQAGWLGGPGKTPPAGAAEPAAKPSRH
ncbi:MAG: hypothetical protein WBD71_05295 [Xanthobacteraceae bacterium]